MLDFCHADLLSGREEPGALEAAIDANVFLDLVDGQSEETEGLRADWLRPLVTLCYTGELLTEISRNDNLQPAVNGRLKHSNSLCSNAHPRHFKRRSKF